MPRIWTVALGVLLVAADARAAKLIAILPLDVTHAKGKLDADGSALLEEVLRDAAANALGSAGWTVLTGETTIQIIRDNGVSLEKCGDEACRLQMARELKVEKFLSGSVQYVDGQFTAVIRAIDSRTGTILASVLLEGATVSALRKDFKGKADSFFSRSGLLAGSAPAPAPPPQQVPVGTSQRSTEEAAPAPAGVPRDLWLQRVNDLLPTAVCGTTYFVQCFSVSVERCQQVAKPIASECSGAMTAQLPAFFDEESGRTWGRKLGECAGARIEKALLAHKSREPKCSDASQWQ